ncbi:dephospho-CoA kinase [bacterium]|nr:dephospho-CoA kinase [bacterium]
MLKIAIVGNIASGKSTAEKVLYSLGYSVLDTDKVSHQLLSDSEIVKKEFKAFDVFDSGGNICRDKLGQLIFFNPELKFKLENILHPLVRVEIEKFFEQKNNENLVFVSIPLLFEAGMEELFDKILFIYTDDDIRLKRLISRNNYSVEYAKIRMDSQISQDEKIHKADWVIYNNSTVEDLEKEILSLVKQI